MEDILEYATDHKDYLRDGELYLKICKGNKFWFKNDKIHREDGPAVEYANGYREWRLNGKKHRLDGPAVEWKNGDKHWYQNGLLHREDGPAVELANGKKEWFQNGVYHRLNGPAIEDKDGDWQWYQNGLRHRDDGPAYKWDTQIQWFQHGQLHRLDGPACEKTGRWYLCGVEISPIDPKIKIISSNNFKLEQRLANLEKLLIKHGIDPTGIESAQNINPLQLKHCETCQKN